MIIREPSKDDLPALFDLFGKMHQESRYRSIEFMFSDVYDLYQVFTMNPRSHFLRMADSLGFFAGYISPCFFNRRISIAYDLALFVDPSNRGGHAAVKLIRSFEKWAKENGAKHIQLGVTTQVNEERTVEFLRRMGYSRCGTILTKEA